MFPNQNGKNEEGYKDHARSSSYNLRRNQKTGELTEKSRTASSSGKTVKKRESKGKTKNVSKKTLDWNIDMDENENYVQYNSEDEYEPTKKNFCTAKEWKKRSKQFEKKLKKQHGYIVEEVGDDGACLFRSISLQIFGDEDMHNVIRQSVMDYIYVNREYFRNFVTEDIESYIERKRRKHSHGNHVEIQAISDFYRRPVELYSYNSTPIIFHSRHITSGLTPLRLSYERECHYNAILDPYDETTDETDEQ